MGKCDERPWVYRAEPITNMSRPLSNKHSTEIGAYLTRYLRRTVVQTRGEGEGGGVSTSVKCLVSITHRVNPHAGSPGGRVHSMSVECLFSMTPSYRRTEEEEKDEEGEIQRRSSACSLFSITPLYRRMEEEEKMRRRGRFNVGRVLVHKPTPARMSLNANGHSASIQGLTLVPISAQHTPFVSIKLPNALHITYSGQAEK